MITKIHFVLQFWRILFIVILCSSLYLLLLYKPCCLNCPPLYDIRKLGCTDNIVPHPTRQATNSVWSCMWGLKSVIARLGCWMSTIIEGFYCLSHSVSRSASSVILVRLHPSRYCKPWSGEEKFHPKAIWCHLVCMLPVCGGRNLRLQSWESNQPDCPFQHVVKCDYKEVLYWTSDPARENSSSYRYADRWKQTNDQRQGDGDRNALLAEVRKT